MWPATSNSSFAGRFTTSEKELKLPCLDGNTEKLPQPGSMWAQVEFTLTAPGMQCWFRKQTEWKLRGDWGFRPHFKEKARSPGHVLKDQNASRQSLVGQRHEPVGRTAKLSKIPQACRLPRAWNAEQATGSEPIQPKTVTMCLTNSSPRTWGGHRLLYYPSHAVLGAMGFSVFPHGFVLFWSDYFHFPVGGGVNVTALLSQFRSMWLSFHLLKDGVLLHFRLAWKPYSHKLPTVQGYRFALNLRDWAQTSEKTL